ncbi:MAG: CHRD domain-containing protein, partial [Cyanobacteria bacterium P01_C01_bin.118]
LSTLFLIGCAQSQNEGEAEAVTTAHEHHAAASDIQTPEIAMESPIALNPANGKEIGAVYEAYLSPEQEAGEEEDTPDIVPDVFKSTAPSTSRELRTSLGHGVLAFTKDYSTAYVHVALENVNPEDITMFHIHCGQPAQLGPIIVDFNLMGEPAVYFEDGVLSMEIRNEHLEAVLDHGEGLVGLRTAGCPIVLTNPLDRVRTLAGMQLIAEQGEIYFNLHTKGQNYFGDIRGQLERVVISAEN